MRRSVVFGAKPADLFGWRLDHLDDPGRPAARQYTFTKIDWIRQWGRNNDQGPPLL